MVIYSSSFPQPVWFVLLPAILLSARNLATLAAFKFVTEECPVKRAASPEKPPTLTHLYPTSCIVMITECGSAV